LEAIYLMDDDITRFLRFVDSIRAKSIDLTPLELSPALGGGEFEYIGERISRNAHINSVLFDMILQQGVADVSVHIFLSDTRFDFFICRVILSGICGKEVQAHSGNGSAQWITLEETSINRQAVFIFDGSEVNPYLEMIVVG